MGVRPALLAAHASPAEVAATPWTTGTSSVASAEGSQSSPSWVPEPAASTVVITASHPRSNSTAGASPRSE